MDQEGCSKKPNNIESTWWCWCQVDFFYTLRLFTSALHSTIRQRFRIWLIPTTRTVWNSMIAGNQICLGVIKSKKHCEMFLLHHSFEIEMLQAWASVWQKVVSLSTVCETKSSHSSHTTRLWTGWGHTPGRQRPKKAIRMGSWGFRPGRAFETWQYETNGDIGCKA